MTAMLSLETDLSQHTSPSSGFYIHCAPSCMMFIEPQWGRGDRYVEMPTQYGRLLTVASSQQFEQLMSFALTTALCNMKLPCSRLRAVICALFNCCIINIAVRVSSYFSCILFTLIYSDSFSFSFCVDYGKSLFQFPEISLRM